MLTYLIGILVAALVKIITFLGIAALIAMIAFVAKFVLGFLFEKLKNFLRKHVGTKVAVIATKKISQEVIKEAKRKGNVHSLAELEAKFKGEGVIIGTIKDDDSIDVENPDNYEIIDSKEMDEEVKKLLDENEGVMIVGK